MPTARGTSANVLELWFHQNWGGFGLENWEVYSTRILATCKGLESIPLLASYFFVTNTTRKQQQNKFVRYSINFIGTYRYIDFGTHRRNRSRLWP